MAVDYDQETRSTLGKITKLAASTTSTHKSLSDQLVHKLGTSRRSEVMGKAGRNGQTFEKSLNDYLDSL